MSGPAGTAGAGPDEHRRGGPPAWLAVLAIGSLMVGVLLIAVQALGLGISGPAAPPTLAPAGEAAARTRTQVVTALERAAFQVGDPQNAYRPGESPSLIGVPRQLLQVVLPSEPGGGYVVIYELPSNADADAAGREFAGYLASGPGAIQYPRDARFVLQRVGQTLVFFPWSPEASPDPRVAALAIALESVGTAVLP